MYVDNEFVVVNVAPRLLYPTRKKPLLNPRLKNQARINPAKAPDPSIFQPTFHAPPYTCIFYESEKNLYGLMWYYIETNVLTTIMKNMPEQMTSEVVAIDLR